jgi:hypothetical protein
MIGHPLEKKLIVEPPSSGALDIKLVLMVVNVKNI